MPEPKTLETKYMACAAIVPECSFSVTAATEEELVKHVAAHAAHAHGIKEVTPDLAAKVRAAIETR